MLVPVQKYQKLEVGVAVTQPVEAWAQKQRVVSSRPSVDRERNREDNAEVPLSKAPHTRIHNPKGDKAVKKTVTRLWFKSTLLFIKATYKKGGLPKPFK